MNYNENFIAKLSSKVDLGTFVLGEDDYPPIFDIAIETVEEEKQRKTQGSFFIKISSAEIISFFCHIWTIALIKAHYDKNSKLPNNRVGDRFLRINNRACPNKRV